jgi:hypothetical protein
LSEVCVRFRTEPPPPPTKRQQQQRQEKLIKNIYKSKLLAYLFARFSLRLSFSYENYLSLSFGAWLTPPPSSPVSPGCSPSTPYNLLQAGAVGRQRRRQRRARGDAGEGEKRSTALVGGWAEFRRNRAKTTSPLLLLYHFRAPLLPPESFSFPRERRFVIRYFSSAFLMASFEYFSVSAAGTAADVASKVGSPTVASPAATASSVLLAAQKTSLPRKIRRGRWWGQVSTACRSSFSLTPPTIRALHFCVIRPSSHDRESNCFSIVLAAAKVSWPPPGRRRGRTCRTYWTGGEREKKLFLSDQKDPLFSVLSWKRSHPSHRRPPPPLTRVPFSRGEFSSGGRKKKGDEGVSNYRFSTARLSSQTRQSRKPPPQPEPPLKRSIWKSAAHA